MLKTRVSKLVEKGINLQLFKKKKNTEILKIRKTF